MGNLWNSKVEFLCNKDREGDWTECDSFLWVDQAADPRDSHYTEGDAWHYRWFVPHNLTNLIQKMGGNALFTKKLETFFEKSTKDPVNFFPNPFFWAGNEPDLQTPYLFVASNFSHLTEKWVDYVREVFFFFLIYHWMRDNSLFFFFFLDFYSDFYLQHTAKIHHLLERDQWE